MGRTAWWRRLATSARQLAALVGGSWRQFMERALFPSSLHPHSSPSGFIPGSIRDGLWYLQVSGAWIIDDLAGAKTPRRLPQAPPFLLPWRLGLVGLVHGSRFLPSTGRRKQMMLLNKDDEKSPWAGGVTAPANRTRIVVTHSSVTAIITRRMCMHICSGQPARWH